MTLTLGDVIGVDDDGMAVLIGDNVADPIET